MLPLYIIEAIEEAGFPLPQLEIKHQLPKQDKYRKFENYETKEKCYEGL